MYTLIPWSITPNTYLLSFVEVACYFKVNVHINQRLVSVEFCAFYIYYFVLVLEKQDVVSGAHNMLQTACMQYIIAPSIDRNTCLLLYLQGKEDMLV